jgi:putative nucleotidyltransferase with HDIG domain
MSRQTFPPEFHPSKQETNQAVLKVAQDCGAHVVMVGGYVRDALLGRYSAERLPNDFDYTVLGGNAMEMGKLFAQRLDGVFVPLDESLDTCRIVLSSGAQVDLAGCMGGSLEADLQRRDLTINALAWDPASPDEIIDRVGGLQDLQDKRVRLISEKALVDDPLRLLRVFRFASSLDFSIEEKTLSLVKQHAERLGEVAAERISHELFLIFASNNSEQRIRQLVDTGLLEIVFPELTACRQVPQNAYHHLGLFDHSVQALIECEAAHEQLPEWAQLNFDQPLAQDASRLAAAKLAALLHDIGKPATWVVRDDGKHTFIGHDKLGAEMVEETAKRLKWARPVEKLVAALVRWHLRPGALFHQGTPTERAVYRFYREVGEDLPELVLLAQSDFRATKGPGLQAGREMLENQMIELLNGYVVFIEGKKRAPKLLDGRDVMTLLGIGPGPVIGELLDDLEEARSLGEVTNKQQAQVFVADRYKEKYSK